jgi:hypothetical protein
MLIELERALEELGAAIGKLRFVEAELRKALRQQRKLSSPTAAPPA